MPSPATTTEQAVISALQTRVRIFSPAFRPVGFFPGPIRKASNDQKLPGAVPDWAVFALEHGGRDDVPYVDGGALGAEQRPMVVLWVRSPPRDYASGKALADAVFASIDKQPPPGFFEARCAQSAALYLGEDDQDHHLWSINVAMKRHKPSAF